MTVGCNIWMICLKLNWYFYGLSRMFQLPQFVWALRCSVWDVFVNFLLIGATDKSKISGDQKRFFIALSLYPLSFFANTPFKFIHSLACLNSWIWLMRKQIIQIISLEQGSRKEGWDRSDWWAHLIYFTPGGGGGGGRWGDDGWVHWGAWEWFWLYSCNCSSCWI